MQLNANRNRDAVYWERQAGEQTIALAGLKLSPSSNRVKFGNMQIPLRPLEFRLLHFFMSHPDQVHTREYLLEQIWGDWIVVGERTVDVHIRRLRTTLEPLGIDRLIQTVHCRGYLFSAAASQSCPAALIN